MRYINPCFTYLLTYLLTECPLIAGMSKVLKYTFLSLIYTLTLLASLCRVLLPTPMTHRLLFASVSKGHAMSLLHWLTWGWTYAAAAVIRCLKVDGMWNYKQQHRDACFETECIAFAYWPFKVTQGRRFWHQSKARMDGTSYWSSTVTLVLSCRVLDRELLYAESHFYPFNPCSSQNFRGVPFWSRSVDRDVGFCIDREIIPKEFQHVITSHRR